MLSTPRLTFSVVASCTVTQNSAYPFFVTAASLEFWLCVGLSPLPSLYCQDNLLPSKEYGREKLQVGDLRGC